VFSRKDEHVSIQFIREEGTYRVFRIYFIVTRFWSTFIHTIIILELVNMCTLKHFTMICSFSPFTIQSLCMLRTSPGYATYSRREKKNRRDRESVHIPTSYQPSFLFTFNQFRIVYASLCHPLSLSEKSAFTSSTSVLI
jgi:hypothetical protein